MKTRHTVMRTRDRVTLAALVTIALLATAGVIYLGRTGRISFREHDGIVINRGVRLEPRKSMLVRYTLTIREGEKEFATFDVPRDVYQRAAVGSHIHRDRFGNMKIER